MANQSSSMKRALVVALHGYAHQSAEQVSKTVGLNISDVNKVYALSIERGFDPIHTAFDDQYVEDHPHPRRLSKQSSSTIYNVLLKRNLTNAGLERTKATKKMCAKLTA
ncbi:hypothetical protein N7462_008838 [Penicillium macrosclerotiorum]|uniref:uncharacterized protein n=1 Tax=Penicillium macrosclerotiorum TaxID=303699 RepID=UPI0025469DC2|nr:uncharacterized protein N7462_008838 [Penicillium macrosclerotiorum]KAJ5675941.1 hypothetical protein N7462_008838 [Penicillium macrosclerotiorum]